MGGNFLLSLGGLLGSFTTVCALFAGAERLDLLLISLIVIFISSCLALLLDDTYLFSPLQKVTHVLFSGALAAAVIAAFTQTSLKLSTVLSLNILTAGVVSSLIFITYLSMFFGILYVGRQRFTS